MKGNFQDSRREEERVVLAKNGQKALVSGGLHINSPYDPVQEAERFIGIRDIPENPSAFLILEPGYPHLATSLSKRYPKSRQIVVGYAPHPFKERFPFALYPGETREPIGAFLRREIGEEDVEGLVVLEWPQGAKAFGDRGMAIKSAALEHLKAMTASLQTIGSRGKLTYRNMARNLTGMARPARFSTDAEVSVIAAAGPTLRLGLDAIRRTRDRIVLYALSSSCPALRAAGIIPDLVLATDPGPWAAPHFRAAIEDGLPLAFAAGAKLPSTALETCQAMILSEGTAFERYVMSACAPEAPEFPPSGTVLSTAIDFALSAARGPCFVLGADFASYDVLSHALPHEFATMIASRGDRTHPFESTIFSRESAEHKTRLPFGWRTSARLAAYAAWMGSERHENANRVFRGNPSPIDVPLMKSVTLQEFERTASEAPKACSEMIPEKRDKRGLASRAMLDLLDRTAKDLRENESLEDLAPYSKEAIKAIDCPGYLTLRKLFRAGRQSEAERLREKSAKVILEFSKTLPFKEESE